MKFNKLIELTVIRKTLVAILLLVCTVLFLLVLKKDAEYVEPVGSYGKPALVIEEKPLRKFSIDQVADDSQCIYLLDESNGVLLVFDVHGTYKYTVFFYDTLNGAFRMAIIQDVLYVQDSQDNIYVFRFGELERFIKVSEQTDDVTINFEQTSSNYELRWNGVYKITADGETCIIHRPMHSIAYNKSWNLLLVFCFFLVMAIYRVTAKHKTG